jgi:DNA invertase Pin-like site-specific DNA recombinase
MRAATYVRCSTAGKKRVGDVSVFLQNPDTQVKPLLELVENRGWSLHKVYSDRMSGAKEARPGLQSLMNDAHRGLFGVVVVWRFDRFARSVKQLVLALEEFRALGIEFISHLLIRLSQQTPICCGMPRERFRNAECRLRHGFGYMESAA